MRVLVKEAGKDAEVRDIDNSLESMQSIVGGYIEDVYIGNGIHLVCNEEGKIDGLPTNLETENVEIVGNVFFCATDDCDCCSLTDEQIEYAQTWCTLSDVGSEE